MSPLRFTLPLVVLSLACGVAPDGRVPQHERAVVDGTLRPDVARGFDAPAENAVVLVEHGVHTCTGTLIADRVVLTAFHCIIDNVADWYLGNGDVAPAFAPVSSFTVAIGAARSDVLCRIDVEDVKGHPLAEPVTEGNIIDNDVAVIILAESIVDTCPSARTIPLADGARGAVAVGDRVVVAGFGATDVELTQFDERRWAELDVTIANTAYTNFIGKDAGAGLPAPGDSGGGVFVTSSGGDGPIVAGISSTVAQPYLSAIKVAEFRTFIIEAAGAAFTSCPDVAVSCFDDVTALACVDGQIHSEACGDSASCGVGEGCIDSAIERDDDGVDAPVGCAQLSSSGATFAGALLLMWTARRRRASSRSCWRAHRST
jgi:hypothetical protein